MKKSLNLKSAIVSEFQNAKTFLIKDTLKIGRKKFLLLAKLKIQFRGHAWLVIWMINQLLEVLMKNNCKKLVNKSLEWKKYLKEKVINCVWNGKVMIIVLIVGLMKKISYKNESILS